MPYEILERKVKEAKDLPIVAQQEICHYVDYIFSIYKKETEQKKDTSFIDDMFGMMTNEEADELRKHSNIHFREVV